MTKAEILETLKANLQGNLSAFYWKETIYEAMEIYANLRLSEQQSKHEQELKKLYEWVLNDKKEPAQTYFSSGIVRNIAREVEFKHEQEMKEFAEWIDKDGWYFCDMFKKWTGSKAEYSTTYLNFTELLTKFKNR